MLEHKSVILEETIESLNIKLDGIYVDGTLGGGRHALEAYKRLRKHGKIIGIDRNADVIAAATERLAGYKNKVIIVRSNYGNVRTVLQNLGIRKVDGIHLDLGVSSYQLDTADRGFTYWENTPLGMRVDRREEETAMGIVSTYSEFDLYRIIRDYRGDRLAKNIVKHTVKAREEHLIRTTGQLIEIIKATIPMKVRAVGGHSVKKTLQATRIKLNHELEVLNNSIDATTKLLNPGGRLNIITFHLLEDRIVKARSRNNENPCACPSDFPVYVCGRENRGKVVTRKPIVPSEEEMEKSKRPKSSRLQVFERI